jgi:malonyl-CoA decarboxylase
MHSWARQQPADTLPACPLPTLQAGLAGVDLGKLLITRVVEGLRAEMPQLQHYATLSPIPNFAAWLATQLAKGLGTPAAALGGSSKAAGSATADVPLLRPQEVQALLQLRAQLQQQGSSELPEGSSPSQAGSDASSGAALRLLQWLLHEGRWLQLPAAEPLLRPLLLRLCARYLAQEKRRGSALDPVAHFHLRNGAVLWRINWRADLSPVGLQRSHGLMVNYKYELEEVHGNNRAYVVDQRVCASQQVMELLA